MLVTGRLESGERVDVTRMVEAKLSAPSPRLSPTGTVRPKADGKATLQLSHAGQSIAVPVKVTGLAAGQRVDYVRDVDSGPLEAGVQRRGPATGRPRARTASSSPFAAMTPCTTSGP